MAGDEMTDKDFQRLAVSLFYSSQKTHRFDGPAAMMIDLNIVLNQLIQYVDNPTPFIIDVKEATFQFVNDPLNEKARGNA